MLIYARFSGYFSVLERENIAQIIGNINTIRVLIVLVRAQYRPAADMSVHPISSMCMATNVAGASQGEVTQKQTEE